jgi:polyisoprenoid-binding protein YceI
VIAADSYDSGLGLRDQDVQENYLEAGPYPLIIFTGQGFEGMKQLQAGAWQFTINGTLELHGATKEVSVPIKLTRQGRKITVEGRLKVLFRDFNIAVPKLLFLRSGDLADVEFRIVGEQQP